MSLYPDTVVTFSREELLCALRHLRIRKEHVVRDLEKLQDTYQATGDAQTQGAMLALETEKDVLTAIIQRLWLPVAGHILEQTRGNNEK